MDMHVNAKKSSSSVPSTTTLSHPNDKLHLEVWHDSHDEQSFAGKVCKFSMTNNWINDLRNAYDIF